MKKVTSRIKSLARKWGLLVLTFLLASVAVYFLFIRITPSVFRADISDLERLELTGVTGISLKGDEQVIFIANSVINFQQGYLKLWDITGKGRPVIGYDFDTGSSYISLADDSSPVKLMLPVDGEALGENDWEGPAESYSLEISGNRTRFTLVVRKYHDEPAVWGWQWYGQAAGEHLDRVSITSDIYLLRAGFPQLESNFSHGLTLGINNDNRGNLDVPPLSVKADSIYLLVTDCESIDVHRNFGDNAAEPEWNAEMEENASGTYLIGLTGEERPAALDFRPLPPDSEGYWSSLTSQETLFYKLPFWPVYFPLAEKGISLSMERCSSEHVYIGASEGEFKVGNKYYTLDPLDELSVISRSAVTSRNGIPMNGSVLRWNSPLPLHTQFPNCELFSRETLVALNMTSLHEKLWDRLPAGWQGAIAGAVTGLAVAYIKAKFTEEPTAKNLE